MKCGFLKNKYKYILNPNNCQQTLTILVIFQAGSFYEPSGQRGLSHFIEHLFFQGTHGKLKNSTDLTQAIYQNGGYINAFTSYDYTGYYIKIDAEHIEEALKVLSEMFFQSKFDKNALEREKRIVIQENHKHASDPYRVLQELNYSLIYNGSPLGESIGGTDKEIKTFNRQKIFQYLNKHYNNAVVSLAGKLVHSEKKTIDLLNKYLGKEMCYGKKDIKDKNSLKPNLDLIYIKPQIKTISRSFKETYVAMAFPAQTLLSENKKERASCDILGVILAGNMTSRLFQRLREKHQLVYNVKYSLNHYEIGGEFTLHCGTDPKNVKKVVSQLLEALSEMKGKDKISQKEFKNAVQYRVGELVLMTEDTKDVAFFQGYRYLKLDECWGINDEIKLYKNLKINDVQQIIDKLIDFSKVNLSIVK